MGEGWEGRAWRKAGPVGGFFRGLMVRLAATLALLVGGFVGIVLYLAFWTGRFAWYQSLAIVLSVLVIVPVVVLVMWIAWGLGMRRRAEEWFDHAQQPH